jgi:hypothetical protein
LLSKILLKAIIKILGVTHNVCSPSRSQREGEKRLRNARIEKMDGNGEGNRVPPLTGIHRPEGKKQVDDS